MNFKQHLIDVRILLAVLFFGTIDLRAQEILQIASFDGEIIEGRLTIPSTGFTNKIVIDVPSSGPLTYEMKRKVGRTLIFNYHDYFADEFARRGISYLSYSTRYTVPDSIPPNYDKVDKEKFFSYTPSIKVRDLEKVVRFLRKDKRLSSCRFILLGWSEGSIIASIVAERKTVPVDALFLAGTPSEDVYTTIVWQHSGASSVITFRKFLDTNKDGIIQRVEYENADPRAIARVGGQTFEQLDIDQDSVLTIEDFRLALQPRLQQILAAVERKDDEWIWNSFFRVGTQWIAEHRTIEANKTRILRLDIPVYLFHGRSDANTPVEGILQLQEVALKQMKKNIQVFVFDDHDHTLEFLAWVVRRSMPEGLKILFDEIEKF